MTHVTTKDGVRLYLKDWGVGRPVILVHGWPLSSDTWDEVALALAGAGMRAIAYDRRGFGRSDQPFRGYDYDTLSDDLATVIDAAGGTDTAIVGFSMGGGEVARYLTRHGGKNVTQAALISSVVPYMPKTSDNPNGVDPAVFAEMAEGMKSDRAHFFTGFFESFFGVGLVSSPVSKEVRQWAWNQAMLASFKATLECADAFATTDFRRDLPSFQLPTLIVHGTADKTVPIDATAREAAKAIRGAKLIEYDGAPHGLFATHKQQLAHDLIAFLR